MEYPNSHGMSVVFASCHPRTGPEDPLPTARRHEWPLRSEPSRSDAIPHPRVYQSTMTTISYPCSECGAKCSASISESPPPELCCSSCNARVAIPEGAMVEGRIERCMVCPSTELYVRKDFSQRWGVGIVVVGLGASCISWYFRQFYITYGILFATALTDAALYMLRGNLLQCYRCQAEYRGLDDLASREPFHLETHEKYRQQAARMTPMGASTVSSKSE